MASTVPKTHGKRQVRRIPAVKVGRCWRCRVRKVTVHFDSAARVFLCASCITILNPSATHSPALIQQ